MAPDNTITWGRMTDVNKNLRKAAEEQILHAAINGSGVKTWSGDDSDLESE